MFERKVMCNFCTDSSPVSLVCLSVYKFADIVAFVAVSWCFEPSQPLGVTSGLKYLHGLVRIRQSKPFPNPFKLYGPVL